MKNRFVKYFWHHRQWLILGIILIVAILVRWPGMQEDRSFWYDELLSIRESRNDTGYLASNYRGVYGASTHSFYTSYQLFRLSDKLMPYGSAALVRLPFFAVGLISIVLAWILGRLWRQPMIGGILALLMALWPFKVYWDMGVRFYAPMITGAVAMLVIWEAYRLRPNPWRLGMAIAVTLLAQCLSFRAIRRMYSRI